MKVYRIKHIPTGLYFCPSREIQVKYNEGDKERQMYVKSNLSKTGKVYTRKPGLGYLGNKYYNHILVKELLDKDQPSFWYTSGYKSKCFEVRLEEWEVIEEE